MTDPADDMDRYEAALEAAAERRREARKRFAEMAPPGWYDEEEDKDDGDE